MIKINNINNKQNNHNLIMIKIKIIMMNKFPKIHKIKMIYHNLLMIKIAVHSIEMILVMQLITSATVPDNDR